MATEALTPTRLTNAIRQQLDAWNQQDRTEIDTNGCRVHLSVTGNRVYVEYLTVPPELRRGGYGAAVMEAVTAWADANGATLRLGVTSEYGTPIRVLRAFYGRCGFMPVGRIGLRLLERRPAATVEEEA